MKSGSEKTLGGIGSIFAALEVIPVLPFIGYILVFIALNKMSKIFNDGKIFSKAIIGVALIFIAGLISLFTTGLSLISLIFSLFSGSGTGAGLSIGNIFLFSIITYIMYVIGYYLFKQSLDLVSTHTNIDLFRTAGTFLFIGSLLFIIPLIGLIIFSIFALVAWIILAIAFFSIPDEYKTTSVEPTSKIIT